MPTLRQTEAAKGRTPIPWSSSAGVVVAHRESFTLPATLAAGDILEAFILPEGHRVVDVAFDADSLDTHETKTLSFDVGFMSGTAGDDDDTRTCGDEFFDGDTTARAGGVARASITDALRTGVSNVKRGIGIKCATAAATKAAGVVGLTVYYVAG